MTWTSFNNRFLHICAPFCYLNSSKIANKSDGVQATVLVDARISVSDKDLPVQQKKRNADKIEKKVNSKWF